MKSAENKSSLIKINGKLESEMADFNDDEKSLMLKDYGIKESGLDTLIKEAYKTLGLETFFTCGEKEVRAWTMKKGSQAVEAAGEIHTDFSTKFIKAEIYSYKDAMNNNEKINELELLIDLIEKNKYLVEIDFDLSLARGLEYYTGLIYEVSMDSMSEIGSIGAGGRYKDLTEAFNLKDNSGIGISFGLERIYLILEKNDLFPKNIQSSAHS